jgi:ubiquinone/menaquinone biosynthesis C-methylase UbiE
MTEHVCPWWGGYFIDNPLRRLLHNPEKILGPYVKPGMTAMDIGCGMGFCSIAMARMVGNEGKVISVDLQQKMLDVLLKRARKAGVAERIETHRCEADSLGVDTAVDFVLAFMMVHEVPVPGDCSPKFMRA